MVEAIEFPHLAVKYAVQGVPRSVFNETFHVEGAVPEPLMLAKLLEAAVPPVVEEKKPKRKRAPRTPKE